MHCVLHYVYIWSAVVLHKGKRYCINKQTWWNNFRKIFFFNFFGLFYCLLKLLIILMENIRHPRKKKKQVPFLFIITVCGEIFAPVLFRPSLPAGEFTTGRMPMSNPVLSFFKYNCIWANSSRAKLWASVEGRKLNRAKVTQWWVLC